MNLNEFLKQYHSGIQQKTGKMFSMRMLSELLSVDQWRLQKWIQRNSLPSSDYDRLRIKEFFGIEDFLDIKDKFLKDAIARYPKGANKSALSVKGNAYDLGPVDDDPESAEKSKSGNEFIDIGSGRYIMLVPLVNEYAYGGYLVGYKDAEYIQELPTHSVVVQERHRGIYRAFVMRGESMDSGTKEAISEGDIVVGRSIDKSFWRNRFHLHKFKDYIIVHKEGILVKRIIEHDVDKGFITIQSINPDKQKYPDDEINLDEVNQIFNITQVTRNR